MIEKLAEYSHNIDQAIARKEWEALSELLEQRQQFLESFFALPIENKAQARQEIERLLERDKEFIELLNHLKQQVSEQLLQLTRGRETVKKYME